MKLLAVSIVLALWLVPVSARAHEDSCGAGTATKLADGLLVRPLSLPFAIAGSALYTGLSPLVVMTGVERETGELLVVHPWRFTGGRVLGCFSTYRP